MSERHPDRRRPRARTGAIAALALAALLVVTAAPAHATVAPAGKVASWGNNVAGQLGNNTTTNSSVPVTATGALSSRVPSTVTSGDHHTCALADGAPYCWGSNTGGQLGDNSTLQRNAPVATTTSGVLSGKTITAIDAGGATTCAVANAKVYCWGGNNFGQLGNNTTTNSSVPATVSTGGALSGAAVTAVAVGNAHTCVLASGKPYCWGGNGSGELGNNTTTNSLVPVPVDTSGALNGKTITAIAVGGWHTCVLADGRPYCWGENSYGELGNNTTTASSVPVAVTVTVGGALYRKSIESIAAGPYRTCVVAVGNPYCWGRNTEGQLGNNTLTDSKVPVAVSTSGVLSGKTTTAIAMGFYQTCAVADAKPYCWGGNGSGQLGNNTTTQSKVPVAVTTGGALNGKVVLDVAGQQEGSVALAMNDPAFCDVTSAAPFFADIVWLAGVGISTGSGGCFQPSGSVTRQAMAAFLYRALNPGTPDPVCTGTARKFTDVPITHPFCGAIEWLESHEITGGYPDGTFRSSDTVTRQAMAAFLFRAINPGKNDPTCTGTDRSFTDVPTDHPFCGPVEWLATTGVTGGYSDGTFKPGGTVTRQAMAAFLHRALT